MLPESGFEFFGGGCLRAWALRRIDSMAEFLPKKWEGSNMRYLMIVVVAAVGASLIGSVAASAAPANGRAIAQAADHASYVTDVAGGCGRGWHRNAWGRCVP
jgi:hypothetical protein